MIFFIFIHQYFQKTSASPDTKSYSRWKTFLIANPDRIKKEININIVNFQKSQALNIYLSNLNLLR